MEMLEKKIIKSELECHILALVNKKTPLIDFPLLDYSSEDIYNVLFDLRNKGLIIIKFNYENKNTDNLMEIQITRQGESKITQENN